MEILTPSSVKAIWLDILRLTWYSHHIWHSCTVAGANGKWRFHAFSWPQQRMQHLLFGDRVLIRYEKMVHLCAPLVPPPPPTWHFGVAFCLAFCLAGLFPFLSSLLLGFSRFSAGVNRGCLVVDFALQLLVAKKKDAVGLGQGVEWAGGRSKSQASVRECIFAFVELSLNKWSHQQKLRETTIQQPPHKQLTSIHHTKHIKSEAKRQMHQHKQSNKGAQTAVKQKVYQNI